jgi:hypothetical protein
MAAAERTHHCRIMRFLKGMPEIKGWKLVLTHAGIVAAEKFELGSAQ